MPSPVMKAENGTRGGAPRRSALCSTQSRTTAVATVFPGATIVGDAVQNGAEVRPVDVNASDWFCTLEAKPDGTRALRLGLRQIDRGLFHARLQRHHSLSLGDPIATIHMDLLNNPFHRSPNGHLHIGLHNTGKRAARLSRRVPPKKTGDKNNRSP